MATENNSNDPVQGNLDFSTAEHNSPQPVVISEDSSQKERTTESKPTADVKSSYLPKKSLAFWAIAFSLCAAGTATALEATITSTALPTIIEALGGADSYIWVVNIFFLTM
jgi:hypothetical protein